MNCPECNAEMIAVTSGPPTTWQCQACSKGQRSATRYTGDTPGDLTVR